VNISVNNESLQQKILLQLAKTRAGVH